MLLSNSYIWQLNVCVDLSKRFSDVEKPIQLNRAVIRVCWCGRAKELHIILFKANQMCFRIMATCKTHVCNTDYCNIMELWYPQWKCPFSAIYFTLSYHTCLVYIVDLLHRCCICCRFKYSLIWVKLASTNQILIGDEITPPDSLRIVERNKKKYTTWVPLTIRSTILV